MGVKGLYSYMMSSGEFLKPCAVRETKLIIDGSNFFSLLYSSSRLDQAHGGDYEAFEVLVTQFFGNLKACRIEPYVILDGGNDVSDKKFDTLIARSQEKIIRAYNLSRGKPANMQPILTKKIFKQILRKLGVPFIQCLAEADWEVAALANEWNCPILSNDSDFYIFGNNGGVLPIIHFQWRRLNTLKGTTKKLIRAKGFAAESLCAAYNNMSMCHLPLFATILGNDYVNLDQRMFPNWAKFSTKPGRAAQIDGLLIWLSRYPNPTEAIAALLSPMGQNSESDLTRRALYKGMSEYWLRPSSIAQFFLKGEPQRRPPGPLQDLPDWTLIPLAECRLGSTVLNVLMLQRNRLSFQAEDFRLTSSNEMSKYIRQVTYGILLCTRRTGAGGHRTSPTEVDEYDRQELQLICNKVPAVLPRCAVAQLNLDTLWETPHTLRLQVLLDTLSVSPLPDVLLIPQNLQLAVYVTCFWLKNAQPEPKAEMFWALLIILVYGELCKEHHSQKEAGTVIRRLKNLKDRKTQTESLDLGLAHAYSQWQKCMKDVYSLNQLLINPVPEPELVRLYSGPLLHCVARELMKGVEPESLLTGASVGIELYRDLQAAVERELDDAFVSRMRTRTFQSGRTRQEDELIKMFKHLMSDDEEADDGDKIHEETCRVRTRHVHRAHAKDPRSKKHERVRWL